jgi:HlyD family secretion protein
MSSYGNYNLIIVSFFLLIISCGKKTEETKPIRKDLTEMVFASGVLEANNTYNLTAQTDGYLVKIDFNQGDFIKAGTVVAQIDNKENNFNNESADALYLIAEQNTRIKSPSLAQAKNNVNLTKAKMELDSIQLKRYEQLFQGNSISKTELENSLFQFTTSKTNYESAIENYKLVCQQAEQALISAKTSKNVTTVLSANNLIKVVVSGKVYKKLKEPGDFVRKGDVIATIGDADFIYAKVNVDETNIAKIKIGQKAVVQLNTNKVKTYGATVAEIFPAFDETSQSFLCKLIFTDSLDFKISGTQLQSNIIVSQQKNALLIPRNYYEFDGTVTTKTKHEKIAIKTSFISKEWVHIVSGIDDQTTLITENTSGTKQKSSELGSQMR